MGPLSGDTLCHQKNSMTIRLLREFRHFCGVSGISQIDFSLFAESAFTARSFWTSGVPSSPCGAKGIAEVDENTGRSARIILTGDFLAGDGLAGDSLAGVGLDGEVLIGVLVLGGSHVRGSCGATDTGAGPAGW